MKLANEYLVLFGLENIFNKFKYVGNNFFIDIYLFHTEKRTATINHEENPRLTFISLI